MKISENRIAILLALAATCIFGRMSFLASSGAFENPEPTRFQQLEMLWTVLHWITPALLIGILCSRQIIYAAAAVKLLASLILLAWEYPSFTPIGSPFPHPPSFLLSMAVEVASGIPFAIALIWIVLTASRKISVRKVLLATIFVPAGLCIAWATPKYFAHRAAMAQWAPEKAKVDATHDIAAGSIKIYMHGSFAAYAVGVEERQRPLIEQLPRAEAGVGCVIEDMDVFEAQGEYATRYNKAIVEHLQRRTNKQG